MLNRLFGNYLIEKQMMTSEQLNEFLPVAKDLKAEVETIAIITKALTPLAVEELLSKLDKGSERFGETAIEAGYLTDEELDQLLTYQSNVFMKFIQSLLDKNLIHLGQITALLDDFQQRGNFDDAQMSSLIHDDF